MGRVRKNVWIEEASWPQCRWQETTGVMFMLDRGSREGGTQAGTWWVHGRGPRGLPSLAGWTLWLQPFSVPSDPPFQDYLLYAERSTDVPGSQKCRTCVLFQVV